MAILRKIFKVIFWFLALVFSAAIAVIIALNLSLAFQEYTAKQCSKILQKSLGIDINIERISLSLPLNVNIRNIYIKDDYNYKLFKTNNINISLSTFRLSESKFYFSSISADTISVNAIKNKGDSLWNYENTLLTIQENTGSDGGESSAYIWFDAFSIRALNLNIKDSSGSKNFNALGVLAEESYLDGSEVSINFELNKYQDSYKNTIENLQLSLFSKDSLLNFKNVSFSNKKSELELNQLKYMAATDTLSSVLEIDMPTLKLFQSEFPFLRDKIGNFGSIRAKTKLGGTFSQLKLDNLFLAFGSGTFFNLKGDITDIKTLNNCFVDVYVNRSNIKSNDVLLLKALANLSPEAKSNIANLNNIQFDGELIGFVQDFVAYGRFETQYGILSTDLALNTSNKTPKFSGSVSSKKLALGDYLQNEKLGKLGFNLEIDGQGSSAADVKAKAKGKIAFVEFNGQKLKGISLDADVSPEEFNGFIGLEDSLTFFTAKGNINYSKKIPRYNLAVQLREKDVRRFIDSSNIALSINLVADVEGEGFTYNEVNTVLNIQSLEFADSTNTQNFNNTILSLYTSPLGKELRLTSNFIIANVAGNLDPNKITQSFLSLLPETPWTTQDFKGRQDFSFSVSVEDNFPIQWLSAGNLYLANGSYLSGNWLSSSSNYTLIIQSDSIFFNNISATKANLFLETQNNVFSADIFTEELSRDKIFLQDLQLNLDYADSGIWTVSTYNDYNNYFTANGNYAHNIDSLYISLSEFTGQLVGKPIRNIKQGVVVLDTTKILANNIELAIENNPFSMDLDYSYSEGIRFLDFYTKSFNLAYINQLGLSSPVLSGIGNLTIDIDNNRRVKGNAEFSNILIEGKAFGKLNANANYEYNSKAVNFNVGFKQQNQYQREEILEAKGKYFFESNELDGSAVFKNYDINKLDRLFTDDVNNIKGLLDGNLAMTGTLSEPQLEGELSLGNGGVHIEYLNADFLIPSSLIKIRPDFVGLDHINVTDVRGKKGYITGTGFHENFRNWNFDVLLEANDFNLLNTTKYDNSLFYGVANISGSASASGYDDKLFFEMNLTPEKGTKIFLPMTDETEVNDQEFVEFVQPPGSDKKDEKKRNSFDNVNLKLNVNANTNAEVAVVFDESAGDIMKVTGNGNLNFEIDRFGEFKARGKYVIDDGDYLFTLENVVNKKFNIRSGSSIFWFGDPYDGILDVTAEYKLRVPLRDIVLIQSERYNRREQVVAILKLQNKLFNPDINFDIYLPNTDDLTKTQVKSVLRTQEEINRQVFSLLIFNRFSPPNSRQSNAFSDASSATTTELLSNQLSNWFSQISSDVDIGVNYSGNRLSGDPTQGGDLTNRQVALALSTQLFNERLTLSTNLGVDQSNLNNTNSNPNNRFISDFSLEYSLTKDGRLKLKAFNETAQGIYLANNLSNYIQGVGLYYRKDFKSFSEAWRNAISIFKREEEE